MRENIAQLGGDINSTNIRCRRCEPGNMSAGGFDPHYGIRICANNLRNRGHLEDTMAHGTPSPPTHLPISKPAHLSISLPELTSVPEMVHAYDHLRFKVDWENNLRHVACSEIRASSLSGECRFMREFVTRDQWKLTQQHQECVRRRAVLSVGSRPTCRDQAHAEQLVDEVWESCFRDTRPFDEIYR